MIEKQPRDKTMIKPSYLIFEKDIDLEDPLYFIYTRIKKGKLRSTDDLIGCLRKIRVGQWMSWCLFLEQDCYLSASCQDEVREKTRELNARR